MPTRATSTPPVAGPATLGRLWPAVLREMAFIRCSPGTSFAVTAWPAGKREAKSTPLTAGTMSTCQIATTSVATSTPMNSAMQSVTTLPNTRRSRRLKRSASTPIGTDPSEKAMPHVASTEPSSNAESVSWTMSHPRAVNSTIIPTATMRLLNQNSLNCG
jgi:hypothetical protein